MIGEHLPSGTTRRRINWRQEHLHAAVILMTACWITPWVALTLDWFIELSLATVLGLTVANLVASLLLVRWLTIRRTPDNLLTGAVLLAMWAAAGLVVLVVPSLASGNSSSESVSLADLFLFERRESVPAGPIIILWVLFLWWRGYQLSSVYMTLVRASFGLRLGLLSFVIIALVGGSSLRSSSLSLIPVFFFFGLLGNSLARAESLSLDKPNQDRIFGRGWTISLVLITLGVTLGGYVAALWFSGIDISRVAYVLGTVGEGVATVLFVFISPLLWVAQVLYNFADSVIPDEKRGTIIDVGDPDQRTGGGASVGTPWLADFLAILSNALLIAVVLLLVVMLLAFVWFLWVARGDSREDDEDDHETLGTGEVIGSWRQALRSGWQRLTSALGLLRQLGLTQDLFAVLTIRRIYARLEKLAGKRGYPRAPSTTPYEYRQALFLAFPGMNHEVKVITEAYIMVRYGDVPESKPALMAVRTAWDTLQNSPEPSWRSPG